MTYWTFLHGALLCCLGMIGASGCAGTSTGSTAAKSEATITGPEWTLESQLLETKSTPVSADLAITLQLDREQKVSGFSGCNTYGGSCTINGKSIRFGPMSVTKKFCSESMEAEEGYLAALRSASHFEIVDGVLTIHSSDGQKLVFHSTGT